jgi:hypothetical protein
MKPVNSAERKKAFYNFLIFFAITIAVLVTGLLFSFQVPFKENNKLRKEMDIAENEKSFLQLYEMKMDETMKLLDSVNLVSNGYRYENAINNNIKAMNAMLTDSVKVKSFCSKILDNLKALQVAKEQLRMVNNSSALLEQKDREIQQLKNNNELLNDRLVQALLRK